MVVLWYLIYSLLLTVIMIKVLLPTCNETLIINSYVLMKCMVPEVITNQYQILFVKPQSDSPLRNTSQGKHFTLKCIAHN